MTGEKAIRRLRTHLRRKRVSLEYDGCFVSISRPFGGMHADLKDHLTLNGRIPLSRVTLDPKAGRLYLLSEYPLEDATRMQLDRLCWNHESARRGVRKPASRKNSRNGSRDALNEGWVSPWLEEHGWEWEEAEGELLIHPSNTTSVYRIHMCCATESVTLRLPLVSALPAEPGQTALVVWLLLLGYRIRLVGGAIFEDGSAGLGVRLDQTMFSPAFLGHALAALWTGTCAGEACQALARHPELAEHIVSFFVPPELKTERR